MLSILLLITSSREAGFTDFDTASSSYYRYIDPNSETGLNEDDETNTVRRGTSGVNQDGINGVVASETGPNAGWLFTVNGQTPSVGADAVVINDGDEIIWKFTSDYTKAQ